VTLLVAVRHQFTQPAVGVCCLCSGQQCSPPSPLQPALTSPPSPPIPFTPVVGCSEWNAGRGRTGASRRRRQSLALAGFGDWFLRNESGHRFQKRVPVTRLPFYNLNGYYIRVEQSCSSLYFVVWVTVSCHSFVSCVFLIISQMISWKFHLHKGL